MPSRCTSLNEPCVVQSADASRDASRLQGLIAFRPDDSPDGSSETPASCRRFRARPSGFPSDRNVERQVARLRATRIGKPGLTDAYLCRLGSGSIHGRLDNASHHLRTSDKAGTDPIPLTDHPQRLLHAIERPPRPTIGLARFESNAFVKRHLAWPPRRVVRPESRAQPVITASHGERTRPMPGHRKRPPSFCREKASGHSEGTRASGSLAAGELRAKPLFR